MVQKQLFEIFSLMSRFAFRKKESSDLPPRLCKIIRARKEQAARNGTHLTVVVFNPSAIANGRPYLADYLKKRIIGVLSKICINAGVVFYLTDKDFSLFLETTLEGAERILQEAKTEFEKEDIRLIHTSVGLI